MYWNVFSCRLTVSCSNSFRSPTFNFRSVLLGRNGDCKNDQIEFTHGVKEKTVANDCPRDRRTVQYHNLQSKFTTLELAFEFYFGILQSPARVTLQLCFFEFTKLFVFVRLPADCDGLCFWIYQNVRSIEIKFIDRLYNSYELVTYSIIGAAGFILPSIKIFLLWKWNVNP